MARSNFCFKSTDTEQQGRSGRREGAGRRSRGRQGDGRKLGWFAQVAGRRDGES